MEEKVIYEKKTTNPNMGRPKKNRTNRLELKLTDREMQMLEACAEMTGKTRTEITVEAIALLYKQLNPAE